MTKTAQIRAFLGTVEFGLNRNLSHEEVRLLAQRFGASEGYTELVVRGANLSIGGAGLRRGRVFEELQRTQP